MRNLGHFFIIAGIALVLLGVVLNLGLRPRWLGRLPCDILIRKGNLTLYFPLATSLLLSLLLSLLFWLVVRMIGKN
jgi:hypothetical protein